MHDVAVLASGLTALLLLIVPTHASGTNRVFVAFDIETTGLQPERCRIVEIGAVKFTGSTVLDQWKSMINPGRPIPERSRAVHGITDAMVADAPTFAEAYPQFRTFVGEATLIAHNAPFDLGFMRAEALRLELPALTNSVIDTLPLARSQYRNLRRHSLEALVAELALPDGGHHRAAADAAHVMALFNRLQSEASASPPLSRTGPQMPRLEDSTNSQISTAGPSE